MQSRPGAGDELGEKHGGPHSRRPTPGGRSTDATRLVPSLEVGLATDVGPTRRLNEDYADLHVPEDPALARVKGAIFVVADGMGGHQAGDIASRQAVSLLLEQYYADEAAQPGDSLVRAIKAANRSLYEEALSDPSKSGMGTTLVAAVIVGEKSYVANVGDSRAYLIGKKGIVQITKDHSWVEEQLRAGLLTKEQARHHPHRHLVTRALGSKASVEVDLFETQISAGDTILLCSDGLTGSVEDAEIAAMVQQFAPEEAARRLIARANERRGSDNVTVLIVTADKAASPYAISAFVPSPKPRKRRRVFLQALASVIVLGLVAGVYSGARWLLAHQPSAATATETTPADFPVASGQPRPEATATLAEIPTEIRPPPTDTALAPADTVTEPVATATPQTTISAPTLVQPQEGASLQGTVTFMWDYSLEDLSAGYAFQVLIWGGDPNRANAPGIAELTPALSQQIDLDAILPQQGGPGQYFWSVVIVEVGTGNRLSRQATPRTLIYLGPE